MTDDVIVQEVHRIREEILAEYGGDLSLLIADAQRRTEAAERGGRQILRREQVPAPDRPGTRKAG